MFIQILLVHKKNGFAEVSKKNLARYRFENNFVWTNKIIKWDIQTVAGMSKFFAALLIMP